MSSVATNNNNRRGSASSSSQQGRVAHSPYSIPVIAYELMSPGTRRYYFEELPQKSQFAAVASPCDMSPFRSPAQSSVEHTPVSTPGRTGSASVTTNDSLALTTATADLIDVPITHNALRGRLPYMTLPAVPADAAAASTWTTRDPLALAQQPRLFFGQVPLEMSMATLKHLIFQLTGIEAIRFDARGFGCYLGFFNTPEESQRVKETLNDRVLFDTHGVWFARNPTEHAVLREYQPSLLRLTPFRLPRHMMSIRDEALSNSPSYRGNHMRQQQQQQYNNNSMYQQQQQHVGGIPQPKRRAKMQQVLSKFYASQHQQQQPPHYMNSF